MALWFLLFLSAVALVTEWEPFTFVHHICSCVLIRHFVSMALWYCSLYTVLLRPGDKFIVFMPLIEMLQSCDYNWWASFMVWKLKIRQISILIVSLMFVSSKLDIKHQSLSINSIKGVVEMIKFLKIGPSYFPWTAGQAVWWSGLGYGPFCYFAHVLMTIMIICSLKHFNLLTVWSHQVAVRSCLEHQGSPIDAAISAQWPSRTV